MRSDWRFPELRVAIPIDTEAYPGIPDHVEVPEKYLKWVVGVGRSARPGEYVIAHPMTGLFCRTDWLGAMAVRALIDGQSGPEVIDMVERIEAGAGQRLLLLLFLLDLKGAFSMVPLYRTQKWRGVAARALGLALSTVGLSVRLAPPALLAGMFRLLLSAPVAHLWRSKPLVLPDEVGRNGSTARPGAVVRPHRSFNYLFMYYSVSLSPERLSRLVKRLFDRASVESVSASVKEAGPTIGVFLHGPLFPAVPNVLRAHGNQVVRAVVPMTHGMYVSQSSGKLPSIFGDPEDMAVATTSPLVATGSFLRHLKAGRSVYVSLDDIQTARDPVTGELSKPKPAATIELLGHRLPRNDGPARLAVRSGCPVTLWSTHCSPSGGVVMTASPLLYADSSLRPEERVAELSERLYGYAEAAIREHPEAWRYWSFLTLMTVDQTNRTD